MKILATISARSGSKGVPNKNIREILGKPLIAYTIEQALACKYVDRVAVSTDSKQIADIAEQCGAEIPFLRPKHLAQDDTPKPPVTKHLVNHYIENLDYVPDYVVDLDPTSPLRWVSDIEACLEIVINDSQCDSVVTGYRSNKNPYFNMVEIDPFGYATLSKALDIVPRGRQDAPIVYAMNASIYVWRTQCLLTQESIVSGNVKFYCMPEERSIDIDSEVDFKVVEMFMKERG